jgi:hypothetical protein
VKYYGPKVAFLELFETVSDTKQWAAVSISTSKQAHLNSYQPRKDYGPACLISTSKQAHLKDTWATHPIRKTAPACAARCCKGPGSDAADRPPCPVLSHPGSTSESPQVPTPTRAPLRCACPSSSIRKFPSKISACSICQCRRTRLLVSISPADFPRAALPAPAIGSGGPLWSVRAVAAAMRRCGGGAPGRR